MRRRASTASACGSDGGDADMLDRSFGASSVDSASAPARGTTGTGTGTGTPTDGTTGDGTPRNLLSPAHAQALRGARQRSWSLDSDDAGSGGGRGGQASRSSSGDWGGASGGSGDWSAAGGGGGRSDTSSPLGPPMPLDGRSLSQFMAGQGRGSDKWGSGFMPPMLGGIATGTTTATSANGSSTEATGSEGTAADGGGGDSGGGGGGGAGLGLVFSSGHAGVDAAAASPHLPLGVSGSALFSFGLRPPPHPASP